MIGMRVYACQTTTLAAHCLLVHRRSCERKLEFRGGLTVWSACRWEYSHGVSNLAGLIAWVACILLAVTALPYIRRTFYWVRSHNGSAHAHQEAANVALRHAHVLCVPCIAAAPCCDTYS